MDSCSKGEGGAPQIVKAMGDSLGPDDAPASADGRCGRSESDDAIPISVAVSQSLAGRSATLLYRMPTKSFYVGSIACRQPAISASTVAFFADRMEYAFFHPFQNHSLLNLSVDFKNMKTVTVQGSASFSYAMPCFI